MFYLFSKCLLKCSLNAVFEARSAIIDMTKHVGLLGRQFQCCYRTKTSRGEWEYIHFYHVLYLVVSYSKVVKLQPWRPTDFRLKSGYWACSWLAKKDTSSIWMGQYEIYLSVWDLNHMCKNVYLAQCWLFVRAQQKLVTITFIIFSPFNLPQRV